MSNRIELFSSIEAIVGATAEVVRPPERMTVIEAAEKYRWIDNPGNYTGQYTNDLTPYMEEPGEVLTSKDFTGMIFVGPAQCAKTELVNNYAVYSGICDPADMMIVSPTHEASQDFSDRRLKRLIRHTPELKSRLLPGKAGQGVFRYRFRSGMLLTLGHPSISQLSGKPIPRLWLTDYDRMPMDVEGEGEPFGLAQKRTTTFKRYGMTVAESSPGFLVDDPKWIKKTPHQAPPTRGILALYNTGDRRRWYWRCPRCKMPFEPQFSQFVWPDSKDDLEKAEGVKLKCPHCAEKISETMRSRLNQDGQWVRDGQFFRKDGTLAGTPYRSLTASFWLKGPAAAFAKWSDMVFKYLKAKETLELTGDESPLKSTVNTDHGEPYTPLANIADRAPDQLKERAEDWGTEQDAPTVPGDVRFLLAAVDVQGGIRSRFVVHIYGVSPGGDIWHVDMFTLRKSGRLDEDGDPIQLDPAAFPEDWDVLIDQVIEASYPLNDGSGRRMRIKNVVCDSGGQEGVTTNAYKFWRRLRDDPDRRGYHTTFQLVKGDLSKNAARYRIVYPDSQRKDRNAGARGDVPVALIQSDIMKDTIYNQLGRDKPGNGMIHYPHWAEDWLYSQLTAEKRTAKGWEATNKKRNEAFDLLYYARAFFLDKRCPVERMDWDDPPEWADVWSRNELVFTPVEGEEENKPRRGRRKARDWSKLGEQLA